MWLAIPLETSRRNAGLQSQLLLLRGLLRSLLLCGHGTVSFCRIDAPPQDLQVSDQFLWCRMRALARTLRGAGTN
jgi:hypothetical protein